MRRTDDEIRSAVASARTFTEAAKSLGMPKASLWRRAFLLSVAPPLVKRCTHRYVSDEAVADAIRKHGSYAAAARALGYRTGKSVADRALDLCIPSPYKCRSRLKTCPWCGDFGERDMSECDTCNRRACRVGRCNPPACRAPRRARGGECPSCGATWPDLPGERLAAKVAGAVEKYRAGMGAAMAWCGYNGGEVYRGFRDELIRLGLARKCGNALIRAGHTRPCGCGSRGRHKRTCALAIRGAA